MSNKVSIFKGSERLKLEFRVTGNPTAQASDGEFTVNKVLFTDYGDRANLVASGVMHRHYNQPRTQMFNVSGYPDKPKPPEWLDELFQEALSKYIGK